MSGTAVVLLKLRICRTPALYAWMSWFWRVIFLVVHIWIFFIYIYILCFFLNVFFTVFFIILFLFFWLVHIQIWRWSLTVANVSEVRFKFCSHLCHWAPPFIVQSFVTVVCFGSGVGFTVECCLDFGSLSFRCAEQQHDLQVWWNWYGKLSSCSCCTEKKKNMC